MPSYGSIAKPLNDFTDLEDKNQKKQCMIILNGIPTFFASKFKTTQSVKRKMYFSVFTMKKKNT